MLRKKQEVFFQQRDNLGQAPSPPHLWIAARSNCLLANSTDSDVGDKTTNLPLFKAMSNLKIRKTMKTNSTSQPYIKVNLSLSVEAMDFLSETTNGTSHFAILGQLIKNTSVTPSTISKRGNVITLGVGQVECSIHSCCAQFGIGRKKFEAIMRKMEQHGIIRMHRSRLATVADMTCITLWLLPDGSTMSNGIDGYPADRSTNGQPDSHDATTYDNSHAHEGKADATSDRNEHRDDAVVMSSDLFAGQLQSEPPSPDWQNANVTKQPLLAEPWLEESMKPLSQNATPFQND